MTHARVLVVDDEADLRWVLKGILSEEGYEVHEAANGPPRLGPEMPDMVMVERFAPGRELTTTVMGDQPLTVTDILTDGWYDYDAKYKPGGSRHVLPADVPSEISDLCLDYALRAHNALGCRGISEATTTSRFPASKTSGARRPRT